MHPFRLGPARAACLARWLEARGGWWPGHRPRAADLERPVLAGVGVLAVFLAFVWGALGSSLLDVDRVEVLGASHVSSKAAALAAGASPGKPIMAVDPVRGSARLEALPWVRRADVRRFFPNRVRILVEERRAAASAARPDGGFAVLDETGRVLAEVPQRPPDLPEVMGLGAPPVPGRWLPGARPALRTVFALPDRVREQVTMAGVAGSGVTLGLRTVAEVRFGPPRELAAKSAALASLLERLGGRPVAFVDLQVASAPVVGPVPAPGGTHVPAGAPAPPPGARGPRD